MQGRLASKEDTLSKEYENIRDAIININSDGRKQLVAAQAVNLNIEFEKSVLFRKKESVTFKKIRTSTQQTRTLYEYFEKWNRLVANPIV